MAKKEPSTTDMIKLGKTLDQKIAAYLKKSNVSKKDFDKKTSSNKKFKISRKTGKAVIRCQHVYESGKQCLNPISGQGIFCKVHKVGPKSVKARKKEKKKNKIGLYEGVDVSEQNLLSSELKEIMEQPEAKITSLLSDIQLSEAVIKKTLRSKIVQYKIGDVAAIGKNIASLTTPEAVQLAMEHQENQIIDKIQGMAETNAKIKKLYYDIKYSDANTIPKEIFIFVFNKIIQILRDEVSDITVLEKIQNKVTNLGIELKEKGFNI